jgi:ankyrin repeat protein
MIALLIAIQNADTEIVHCLLPAGASFRDSPVALNGAIAVGRIDIVALLMQYGANPPSRTARGGRRLTSSRDPSRTTLRR